MANNSLTDGNYALITGSTRSKRLINIIFPDVVVEEITTDTLRVTDHPVETGCAISDHAFKMPVEIIMRCGFSDSTGLYEGYSAQRYDYLVVLQNQRKPFNVSTPKRNFTNMLISFLHVTEDFHTTHALNITVGMREVIITNTTVTQNAPVATNSTLFQLPSVPPIVEQFNNHGKPPASIITPGFTYDQAPPLIKQVTP